MFDRISVFPLSLLLSESIRSDGETIWVLGLDYMVEMEWENHMQLNTYVTAKAMQNRYPE